MVNGCSLKVGSRSSNKPARVSGSLKRNIRQQTAKPAFRLPESRFCRVFVLSFSIPAQSIDQSQLTQAAGDAIFGGGGADVAGKGFEFGGGIAHGNAETDGFEHFPIV